MKRQTKAKIVSTSSTKKTLTVNVEFKIPVDRYYDEDEVLCRLKNNLKWLPEHLAQWADFDWCFTAYLFADSLESLGKGLLEWDNCLHSQRNGKRALFAARRLRCLVEGEYDFARKAPSMTNHMRRTHRIDVPLKNGHIEWRGVYNYDNAMGMDRKEYETKMYRIIHSRLRKAYEDEWNSTWAYITKYLRYWWD